MSVALIEDLKGRRASLISEARVIVDGAESEDRDLTAEETQEYERLMEAVEANEARSARLEALASVDVPNPAKVESTERKQVSEDEHRDAFEALLRNRGQVSALSSEQRAALQVGTDSEGGYTVPREFHRELLASLREFSVARQLAKVFTTSGSGTLDLTNVATHSTATWTAEEAAYTESEPTFGRITIGAYKLGVISKISDELLHDSAFDILGFVARDAGEALALAEGAAFIGGASDATTSPKGLVALSTSGVTAASSTAITTDELIDLQHSIRIPYRGSAAWLFNDSTVKALRKLKDDEGRYVWQPSLQAGEADILLGRPVYTDPNVPAIEAAKKVAVYGDVGKAYWIRDVEGDTVKVLNELYAENGQVGYRVSRRTDGNLVDSQAVRSLTMKAA